jgi:hypothetical protein
LLQSILANEPLTTVPPPIATLARPKVLVVTAWFSLYTTVPLLLPCSTAMPSVAAVFA